MKALKVALVVLAFGSLSAFAGDYDSVVDDSVIGYWRFNDPGDYGKDSSGHGGDIVKWNNGATGVVVSVDWSRGGGCLELPRKGNGTTSSPYTYGTAVATLTSGKTLDMSRISPGWTVATWVRGSAELVSSLKNSGLALDGTDAGAFKNALKDGKWHPLVIVYRSNNTEDFYRVYVDAFDSTAVRDITAGGTDSPGNPAWHIPLATANDMVTLGGDVGGTVDLWLTKVTVNGTFFGGLDDCIIIDRELAGGGQQSDAEKNAGTVRTNDEVFRLVQTGETFVFSKGSSGNMFYEAGNWSNGKVPQAGLAYMIENGHEVKSSKTATFAGKSLSVGRTEKLYGIKSVGGSKEVVVDNTVGKLTQQGANTTLTVDELRLNDGILASMAGGQSLSANVTVSATKANPFEINVSAGTYRITGRVTGGGCVVKRGSGTLDLSGLSELDAQIVVEAGAVRLPTAVTGCIDYSGGEIVIAHDDKQAQTPVLIRSSTVWPIVCRVEGEFGQVGSHALFAVSNSVKEVVASDFAVTTTTALGLETEVRIEKGDAIQLVSVDVVACDRYTIGSDTFEEYVVGDEVESVPGWKGTGSVFSSSPTIPTPPSYALDGVEHTKALAVEESAIRTYADNFARDNQILDVLFQICRGPLDAAACEAADVTSGQMSFGVDEDGCICVYHPDATGAGIWSKLSFGSKSSFADGEWVRLTCIFDYCSNADGRGFVQVRVNGNCGVSPDGVRSPTDGTANGSWFRLFDKGGASERRISRLGVYGETQIDDVVVSAYKKSLKPETHTCEDTTVDYSGTYGSGKTAHGKISYAQCDAKGIPRDLDFDSDGDGVSNGVELLKGTDPLDPNSFPGGGMMLIVR